MSNASEISVSRGHKSHISESTFERLYETFLTVYYKADRLGRKANIAVLESKYTTIEAESSVGMEKLLMEYFCLLDHLKGMIELKTLSLSMRDSLSMKRTLRKISRLHRSNIPNHRWELTLTSSLTPN